MGKVFVALAPSLIEKLFPLITSNGPISIVAVGDFVSVFAAGADEGICIPGMFSILCSGAVGDRLGDGFGVAGGADEGMGIPGISSILCSGDGLGEGEGDALGCCP